MYFTSAFTVEGTGSNFVPCALFIGAEGAAEHEMVLACINSKSSSAHAKKLSSSSLIDPLPFYSYL